MEKIKEEKEEILLERVKNSPLNKFFNCIQDKQAEQIVKEIQVKLNYSI